MPLNGNVTNKRESAGVVEETLPRGLFRVRCEDGRSVTAAIGAQARRVTVALKPGDKVTVELSPFDPTRGRITAKQR